MNSRSRPIKRCNMTKTVVAIVGCRSRPDQAARTCRAIEAQTVSTEICLLSVGRGAPFPSSMRHSILNLPLSEKDTRLAGGIGMQLALNEQADFVGLFHAGDEPEPDFVALMSREITRTGADIILLRGNKPAEGISSIFITARAAFAALIWAQTSGQLEAHFCEILGGIASRLRLKMHYLGDLDRKQVFRPSSDLALEIYKRTGFALRSFVPTSSVRTGAIAVV